MVFLSPSIMKSSFAGYNNLGWQLFSFSWLGIYHSLPTLLLELLLKKSAVIPMVLPLYVTYCFSLSPFNILSLICIFSVLILMCLGV
jgi:hypothetical protein